jgi:hypothetical protein
MTIHTAGPRALVLCAALGALLSFSGCGSKETPAPAAPAAPAPAADATGAPVAAPVTATEVTRSWTPEALEELLAPIALYPDPVLSQVLIASTNPQEVLDAGNWLIANPGLKGTALDDGAAQAGFTPPIRALVQFPETVDMMCLELGWTTELGEAFVADQAGVLGAVQRLRRQAMDVGNLQSSAQMKVETQRQEGQEVVVLKPAQPEVVYVPQYDPVAAYAPPPAADLAAAPAAATTPATTTTTTVEQKSGYSTGAMVTTGVLAFGAGILVNELFDDDDHHHKNDYYYPNYGYGGMPYYPPYPYRPSYGGGYYPSNGYNRPPGYNSGFVNTGNIIVTNPGGNNRPGNGYWDRYESKPGRGNYQRPNTVKSPITAAKPNRPELNDLNKRQPRAMPADVKRPSADATAKNWKGQSGYAGAKDRDKMSSQERIANAQPGYSKPAAKPATGKPGSRELPKAQPKVQGSYAGAKPDRPQTANAGKPGSRELPKAKPQTRDVAKPAPSTKNVQRPSSGQVDRGYGKTPANAKPAARPQQVDRPKPANAKPMPTSRPAPSGGNHGTAMSGSKSGKSQKAASQRGKQSMPQGARSKGGGGGGGKKKQR